MKRLVSDENFNGRILRGLVRRDAEIDLVKVVAIGLGGIKDPALLAWAATQNRIILTHDRKTMVPDAKQRMTAGEPMTGLIVVSEDCRIGLAIEDILLALDCYAEEGWENRIVNIPL